MATARKPPSGENEPPVPPEQEAGTELGPRKLIRPSLSEVRRERGGGRPTGARKSGPPEQTNAEANYYLKQMQARTPVVVRLMDGEELRGWIEWYDRDVIKLNRDGAPNLLLPKHAIKYIYKEEEERQLRRQRLRPEGRGPGSPGRPAPPGESKK